MDSRERGEAGVPVGEDENPAQQPGAGAGHFDHMAGAAQILRETGAKNMVMEGEADVVESVRPHD